MFNKVRVKQRKSVRGKTTTGKPLSSRHVSTHEIEGITITVTRKRVKNINLRIKSTDGSVSVSAPLWISDTQINEFLAAKSNWLQNKLQNQNYATNPLLSDPTPEQLQSWQAYVKQETIRLVKQWEPIIGVKSQKLAYRNMTSRWGSCNPSTGRICINIRLGAYPPECLEYIVVHELCHLLERGHGPKFKALLDNHLPNWKQTRAKLRS